MRTKKNQEALVTATHNTESASPVSVVATSVVNAEALLPMLVHALKHASLDDTRPHLACVLLHRAEGALRVVATDGHALAMFETPAKSGECDYMLIRRETVEELIGAIKSTIKAESKSRRKCVAVTIAAPARAGDNRSVDVVFSVGAQDIKATTLSEQYPPYNKVIPSHAHGEPSEAAAPRVGISPVLLARAVEATGAVCDSKGVELRVGNDPLQPIAITAKSGPRWGEDGANESKAIVVLMPMRT